MSGEMVRAAFDNLAVRVGFGALIVLPTSVLATFAIPMSFSLGVSGFAFGPLSIVALIPNALLSLLGLIGAWFRVSRRSTEMTASQCAGARRLLSCGVASSAYWAVCGVPALGLTGRTAVLSWALACLGAFMIYGTPQRLPKVAGQSASTYRTVILTGLVVLGYTVFSATYGDPANVPRHITAALIEERYGKYLDQAEALAKMPATDERNDADKALRALLQRDDTVLWLYSTDDQPIFAYRKDGESSSGYGCVGTSDPQQAGVLRCTINGDHFGDRGLRYRRGVDFGTDGASVMLDFRVVDDLLRAGRNL